MITLVGNQRVAGVERPSAVDEGGSLISKAAFRSWLEAQPDIGPLDTLMRKVLGRRATADEVGRLAESVVTACRGAYAFPYVDWRAPLRSKDAWLKPKLPILRDNLLELQATLQDSGVRLSTLTDWFNEAARFRYGRELVLPFPAEGTLLELVGLLADGLDTAAARIEDDDLPHVRQHGCLDYGRPVPLNKFRDRRPMLGFNLVFLFRAATNGSWATEGSMPTKGRPCFPIAAQLVGATLGERLDDAATTASWLHESIRSIKRDNPCVSLIPWPVSADEVGTARWYAPSLIDD